MKGNLTYTQRSVAFPAMLSERSNPDELLVSFDLHDGSTYGEFTFRFHMFDTGFGHKNPAVQVCVFGDGLGAFYDARVQRVIDRWRRARHKDAVKPETLIRFLEDEGAVPSRHHQEGLRERV